MTRTRDAQQSAVYSAEQLITALMDSPHAEDTPTAFHGSTLPPIEQDRKFADIASVQRYVDALNTLNWGYSSSDGVPPVMVRNRKGSAKAHWEFPNVIAIPFGRNGGWACREMVVLHEYAHHAAFHLHGETTHGEWFQKIHCDLVRNAVGGVAGLLLTAAYDGF
ncbi:MAG: TIGR04338 family metallohydrolase [Chryseobacterium sp.]|nr:MAG: TIGR04338 family metallohydrolase [Chryseobacterium sp.]